MQRIHVVCALAAAFCVSAHSAQAGTLELGLGYNKSWAKWGTTGQPLGGGLGVGIAYWRRVSPDLSWGLEASYDDLGKLEYSYLDQFSGGTPASARFDLRILRFNPAFRVHFGRPEGPSFLAQVGAGLYETNIKFRYVILPFLGEDDRSETKFGFHVGSGVGLPLGRTKRLNVMAAYHIVGGEDDFFVNDFNNFQIRASLASPL
jgi:outer membrane protein with beta-barrel domain